MLRSFIGRRSVGGLWGCRVGMRRRLLTVAHTRGPSEPPLLEQTIPQNFQSIVSAHGDRPAVISRHQQTQLTYDALDTKSNALARGLANIGVRKGDRVAVFLGNNIEFATATYALFKLGAILVPLNPAFNSQQTTSALTHLEVSHLIVGTETNRPWKPPRSNIPLLAHIVPTLHGNKLESELVPSLKQIVLVDNSHGKIDTTSIKAAIPYASVLEDGGPGRPIPDQNLHPHDIINIQFTSGTTSTPKAACLSHRSILNNGASIGDRMLLTPTDTVCCPPPLFHCFGSILGYMATATHGSAIVFPTEAFDPHATLAAVHDYACTALYGVPTMFLAELDLLPSFPRDSFRSLRTGIAAGSSVPAELMRKLHRDLNLTDLTICYGMTETSPVSAMTTTTDPLQKRIDTVGRPLPHVEAKIVDVADRTTILPVHARGELVVAGYLTMSGYWGDAARTAEVLVPDAQDARKMWMHTGDEASMDEEGYVTITGRIKDLIIRGGENIQPLEVENCLLAHEGVGEVSVVGVEDGRYGEVVGAFVVRRRRGKGEGEGEGVTTAGELREWVRERLSGHLVPKYIFWCTSFPRTPSGKIQKFKLREEALRLLREGKGSE